MEDVRVYGDFHRVNPEMWDKIQDLSPFEQVDYDGDVLRVDHEGHYILIDDFIEAIRDLLPENGYGHVEFIDQLEWTVTRYTIKPGKIEEKLILVDNVVDAHQRENGL